MTIHIHSGLLRGCWHRSHGEQASDLGSPRFASVYFRISQPRCRQPPHRQNHRRTLPQIYTWPLVTLAAPPRPAHETGPLFRLAAPREGSINQTGPRCRREWLRAVLARGCAPFAKVLTGVGSRLVGQVGLQPQEQPQDPQASSAQPTTTIALNRKWNLSAGSAPPPTRSM